MWSIQSDILTISKKYKDPWKHVKSYGDILALMGLFLVGKLKEHPTYFGSLEEDTVPMMKNLVKMTKYGVMSTNGQGGEYTKNNRQRAYLELYIPKRDQQTSQFLSKLVENGLIVLTSSGFLWSGNKSKKESDDESENRVDIFETIDRPSDNYQYIPNNVNIRRELIWVTRDFNGYKWRDYTSSGTCGQISEQFSQFFDNIGKKKITDWARENLMLIVVIDPEWGREGLDGLVYHATKKSFDKLI